MKEAKRNCSERTEGGCDSEMNEEARILRHMRGRNRERER